MVLLEAAKALVALPVPGGLMALGGDLTPAITMLHMFLTSPKPANRFAAVRALHALSGTHPAVVSATALRTVAARWRCARCCCCLLRLLSGWQPPPAPPPPP